MKNSYLPFLFVFGFAFSACNNSTTTNTPTTENVVIDTSEIVKQYIPETKPKGMVLSQKDIVMNDAVVISNDFYNNLKNQTYSGANKYMHPDALSVTSVTPDASILVAKSSESASPETAKTLPVLSFTSSNKSLIKISGFSLIRLVAYWTNAFFTLYEPSCLAFLVRDLSDLYLLYHNLNV